VSGPATEAPALPVVTEACPVCHGAIDAMAGCEHCDGTGEVETP
jgi:hypothetical protein